MVAKKDIPNKLLEKLKRLTPEQWELAKPWISDMLAKRRRERLKLIRGRRRHA
jgi:hypothetical protein